MLTEKDIEALKLFTEKYPSWWYTIGVCDISRDFTAGPQSRSPEIKYAHIGNDFDVGFMVDSCGSVADAIKETIDAIEKAIQEEEHELL